LRIALVIPALDEAATIADVVRGVDRNLVDRVVVVDNGSVDATAEEATEAGALVVSESRRGYGSACLAGIAAVPEADVLVFMDGDGSDDPTEIESLVARLVERDLDMVVGSRTRGECESGALTPVQAFGNLLTCSLVRLFWGVRFTDLGPFRVVRREALRRLAMRDPDFGWTIEMQVKAAQQQLRVEEIPVRYRRRQGGQSKVSGTVIGSYRAGRRILGYVLAAKLREICI
jgi:glycosyltransferase involved in cell wall biosynthesis